MGQGTRWCLGDRKPACLLQVILDFLYSCSKLRLQQKRWSTAGDVAQWQSTCLACWSPEFGSQHHKNIKKEIWMCASRKGQRGRSRGWSEGGCGMLTPNTFLAPALAANMDKIPVPLPTSRTTLSLNTCLLWYMEFRYVSVRTSSLSISCSGRKGKQYEQHVWGSEIPGSAQDCRLMDHSKKLLKNHNSITR